eukprot:scaffold5259_cov168-Ochromonas_danica.AAC.6
MSQFTHYRVHSDRQIPEITSDLVVPDGKSYLERLISQLNIVITHLDEESIEFDLIDPSKLDYVVGEEETDRDTIVFHYDVECKAERVTKANGKEEYVNESALSSALTWLPQGSQSEMFPEGVKPVHDDIVIAKLRPGQRIEFEAHCRKGVGKDHTKFSPVATASYRLLPEITLLQPITGEDAVTLKNMCPMDVFDIEELGKNTQAKVGRPRDCTMCRECIRHEGWDEKVKLARKNDHFLFSVESTGVLAPETIVREGIRVLKDKATRFQGLGRSLRRHEESGQDCSAVYT